MPKLSLIIATYNRGERLLNTLRTLVPQTLDRSQWELVVVDNNSTDDTAGVFRRFAAENPGIDARLVGEPEQGVSAARNRGIAESSGEYIVIIDDDEEVVECFLSEYYDFFGNYPEAAAAGGRIIAKYESAKPKWLSRYTERPIAGTLNLGRDIKPFPDGKFFGGGNMAVRRSALDRCGLFDTQLGRTGTTLMGGEEKDLYLRLKAAGEQIYYLPRAAIYHLIPPERLTDEYFLRLCSLIGRSERVRTMNISKGAYVKRLLMELVKWGGVFVLSAGYLVGLQPARARYLFRMRWRISAGLLSRE